MARTPKAKKGHKVSEHREPTLSTENHMQVFARLSKPMFNHGAMHNPPSPNPKRA